MIRGERHNYREIRYTSDEPKGMSRIVKTITRLSVGIILLYGINILMQGTQIPGGGFAGGGIIALAFLSLIIAFGKDAAMEKLNCSSALGISAFGFVLFMSLGTLGFLKGSFFKNYFLNGIKGVLLFSGGSIPLYNLAICMQVGAGIFAIFVCLVLLKNRSAR